MSTRDGGDGERNDGDQRKAYMIPGVDGKLQFGFPKKIITILRYAEFQQTTSTSGGINTYIYRMNGPFDPDLTGSGHQPLYWDQFTPVYQNYRVLGSKINVEWSPQTPDDGSYGPFVVGITGSTSSSSLGTLYSTRMEMNDSVHDFMGTEEGNRSLWLNYSPERSLGRPAGDDTVGALVTTTPTQQYFAHVWMADVRGTATSSVVFHRVMIEYTIEFFGQVIAGQS